MGVIKALSVVLVKPDSKYSSKDIPDLNELKEEPLAAKLAQYREIVERKYIARLEENTSNKSHVKVRAKVVKDKEKSQEKSQDKKVIGSIDYEIGE